MTSTQHRSDRRSRSAPMLAKAEAEIPVGKGWTYEPKWDGFRTIVIGGGKGSGNVTLISRDDRPMNRFFPEIEKMIGERAMKAQIGPFMADAELVMVRDGMLEFDDLQLRLHPAESRVAKLSEELPATLLLFDLVEESGDDLRELPLAQRRKRLQAVAKSLGAVMAPKSAKQLPAGPGLALTPFTDDPAVAKKWFSDTAGFGADGVVAKQIDQEYLAGKRGWVKVKHIRAADCVVGGFSTAKTGGGIASLLLGIYDDAGVLQYVGHTSSFKAAERVEIRKMLEPLITKKSPFEGGHEPGGPSRWTGDGKETPWTPIKPTLVCEVKYDRFQNGRFRHATTFLRWRDDRKPKSCKMSQLG